MSQITVKAAVFRPTVAAAQMETLTMGPLQDDEVLVKLVATGVCHTDITCRDGFMPMPRPIILGHEGAGRVEQVGAAVKGLKPGDPVVMTFLACGQCINCKQGIPSGCHQFGGCNMTGRRLDGSTALSGAQGDVSGHFFCQSSFATYSVAKEASVVKVRADAPLEILGPLGCGVQTGAGSVFNVLQPKAGESIVIFGAGGVGLSGLMAAAVVGCNPMIVVEPRAERRALASELGATHLIDPAAGGNVVDQLMAITGFGVQHAFDTSGHPDALAAALAALAPRGRLALVSLHKLDAVLPVPLIAAIGKAITIRGVNMGDSVPKQFIPKLVDLIMDGKFPLQKLVRFYAFDDINQALEDQDKGRAVKPILRMS
jgi:Zn-dependent alcohol dehydrogenase